MEHVLIYDLISEPNPLHWMDYVLLALGALVAFASTRTVFRKNEKLSFRLWLILFCPMSILVIYTMVWGDEPDRDALTNAYTAESYDVVEGVVEDFNPGYWAGNGRNESFSVDDVRFEYTVWYMTAAYNTIQPMGEESARAITSSFGMSTAQ